MIKYFEYTIKTKSDYTINVLSSFVREYFGVDFKTYIIVDSDNFTFTVGILTSADFISPYTRIKFVFDPRSDNTYKGWIKRRKKRKTFILTPVKYSQAEEELQILEENLESDYRPIFQREGIFLGTISIRPVGVSIYKTIKSEYNLDKYYSAINFIAKNIKGKIKLTYDNTFYL